MTPMPDHVAEKLAERYVAMLHKMIDALALSSDMDTDSIIREAEVKTDQIFAAMVIAPARFVDLPADDMLDRIKIRAATMKGGAILLANMPVPDRPS